MGTVRVIDSFEHQVNTTGGNVYALVTNASTGYNTTAPIHGTASMQYDAANAGQRIADIGTISNLNVARAYFKITQQDRTDSPVVQMLRLRNAADTLGVTLELVGTAVANVQTVRLKDNLGGTTAGFSVTTNVVYRVDIKYNWSANPWLTDWSIAAGDATTVAQAQLSTANAITSAQYFVCGSGSGVSTVKFLIDSVVLANGNTTDYPFSAGAVWAYSPTGVGTHVLDTSPSAFFFTDDNATETAITSAETTSYTMIDEKAMGSGVDRVEIHPSPANTTYLEHTFSPNLTAAPRAARIVHAVRQDTATASPVTGRVYDGTTASDIYTALSVNSVANLYRHKTMDVTPTGLTWTAALFNSLKSRFGLTADATGVQRLEAVVLEAFVPSFGSGFENVVAPTVTGALAVGGTLTLNSGTWTPTPSSYNYYWHRSDDAVGTNLVEIGATGSTYTLATADINKYIRACVIPVT